MIPATKFTNLLEAKFSEDKINRVLILLERLLQKRVGQKFYRVPEPFDVNIKNHPGNGKGYLLLTPRRIGVRFNFVKGEFVSAQVWRPFIIDKPSDQYIEFAGINIVQIVDKLVDLISSAIRGEKKQNAEIPVYLPESHNIYVQSTELLTEARRSNPTEFYGFLVAEFGDSKDLTKISFSDIAAVAAKNDVQVPGYVRKQTLGKNIYNAVPPADISKVSNLKSDPILYIKVTAKDPVSGKFLTSADNKDAQDAYKKIQTALTTNDAATAQKEIKHPGTLFNALANLSELVVKGFNKSLLIYGGPGTGKTFTVLNEIKKAGLVKNKDWYHSKGKATAAELYKNLFLHRDDKLIVFDDIDSIFGSEDSANILKAALDSYDTRYISWLSNRTVNVAKMDSREREEYNQKIDKQIIENPESNVKFPSEFRFDGRIIFISNLPEDKIDSAVLSRSFKINMDLTDEQMFMRIESIIEHLGEKSLPLEQKKEILQELKNRHKLGDLKSPNMRTFVAATKLASSGMPNWMDLLQYT